MDIYLINPRDPILDTNIFDSVLNRMVEMVPLGLLYIATMLKERGYQVEIVDFNTIHTEEERQRTLNDIAQNSPKIIGFSVMTPFYPKALEIATNLREKLGNTCAFIWGGYHVSFLPEEPLQKGLADIVVRGEGEYIMQKLASVFIDKNKHISLGDIESISYLKNGEIIHNGPSITRIKDLDSIPYPNRNLIDFSSYTVPATIVASRGCMGRCQFCAAGSWGEVESRSEENIFGEIKELSQSNPSMKHIFFVDNCFIGQRERLRKIFDLLNHEGIRLTYSLEARVNHIDEAIIKNYQENHVIAIQFGVESGNEEILKKIRKGITLEKVIQTVELCVKYGVIPYCSFIIGHPFDTRETINDTINFAKRLKRSGAEVGFSVLTPYPGTEIFNNREELGVTILDWNFEHWDTRRIIIKTKNLSRSEIADNFKHAVLTVRSI